MTDKDPRSLIDDEVDRRLLHSSLKPLKASGHPLLRNVAEDLLAGRVSIRELTRNPELAAPLQAANERYLKWRKGLSEKELEAITHEMTARVERLREQVTREWRERHAISE
jgi:hypothetical protein